MTESWHDVANKRADRVRELEAELDAVNREASGYLSRAERAEASIANFREFAGREVTGARELVSQLLARAEKAEARVAELEEHLAGRDGFHEYGGECYEFVAENPPEREADQD